MLLFIHDDVLHSLFAHLLNAKRATTFQIQPVCQTNRSSTHTLHFKQLENKVYFGKYWNFFELIVI